jgi:hypothetical protein
LKRCEKDSGAIVMSHVSLRLLFALALVLGGLSPSVVMAQSVYGTYHVTGIFHMLKTLAPGESMTVSTTDLTGGADTVIQIWDVAAGTRADWNDDRSATDLSSQASVVNSAGVSRTYQIFMHSGLAPSSTHRTARVWVTTSLLNNNTYSNVTVGGGIVNVRDGASWTHQTVERGGYNDEFPGHSRCAGPHAGLR